MTQQEHRRTRLRLLEDQQAIQTRGQLAAAFLAAAEERPRGLSVRWICDRAAVGRSTFYTHFSSVEDLAAFVLTGEFEELVRQDARSRSAGVSGAIAARATIDQVVAGLVARRELIAYAANETSRPAIEARMVAWLAEYSAMIVESSFTDWDERHLAPLVDFISAGAMRAILNWLDAPNAIDEGELVEVLLAILPERLRSPIPEHG